ncbi:sensor domain-containing diguanylate cyclase [Vibrio cortegadensis]|uniref:diguanylate cyclase n=1 Tax=Vibrio cortegadensis TaxID=1328770 RepID=A0ABV4M4E8_9VIBR
MVKFIRERNDILRSKNRRFSAYIALIFLFILFVATGISLVTHKNIDQARAEKQTSEILRMQDHLLLKVRSIGTDLTYFAHSDLAQSVLMSNEPKSSSYLASLMLKITTIKKQYDQIRIIDSQGQEVIRIDQQATNTFFQVPSEGLQDKSARYYFQKTRQLKPNQIFISKFDLNKEHGKVESPIKPMIRFSTPIYSPTGSFLGIGIINYRGSDLLHSLDDLNIHNSDYIYLVNDNGYLLKGYDKEKEWSFMYPEKKQYKFSDEFSTVWASMTTSPEGMVTTPQGEFYFLKTALNPFNELSSVNSESLFLVMHVPKSVLTNEFSTLMENILIAILLVTPIVAFLSYQLASSQEEQKWLVEKLTIEARHDGLTGLYNRHAIVEFLEEQIDKTPSSMPLLSVGFIDANNLKKINDNYGHEAGDNLIKGLAKAISSTVRTSDFSARLGGDEFLIVFMNCNVEDASHSMHRILANLRTLGLKGNMDWSMSYGCAELLDNDSVESLIGRADKDMYKQKLAKKNQ